MAPLENGAITTLEDMVVQAKAGSATVPINSIEDGFCRVLVLQEEVWEIIRGIGGFQGQALPTPICHIEDKMWPLRPFTIILHFSSFALLLL